MKQSKRYCSRRARELCREFFPAGCLTSGAGAGLEIPRGVLFFRRPEGVQGASGKPRASIGMRQFCHENFPCGGLTRRLRRGAGLASLWGAHTFLSMAKEKCAKESQRHGTTGKRLLLPILTAGLAMSRAMELDSYHLRFERARAHLFPPSKWAGLFPCVA